MTRRLLASQTLGAPCALAEDCATDVDGVAAAVDAAREAHKNVRASGARRAKNILQHMQPMNAVRAILQTRYNSKVMQAHGDAHRCE